LLTTQFQYERSHFRACVDKANSTVYSRNVPGVSPLTCHAISLPGNVNSR
jgi:hypothetical protein